MDTEAAGIHTGSTILDSSAKVIGTLAEVFHDNRSGRCRWAQVSIRGRCCLVPLAEARVDGNTVRVPVTAEQIVSAPHHDSATALTVDDEHDLDWHYALTKPAQPFVVSVAQQPSLHRRAATDDAAMTGLRPPAAPPRRAADPSHHRSRLTPWSAELCAPAALRC